MRTKKPKRRYDTANDIRDEINRQLCRSVQLLLEAETLETKAKMLNLNGPEFREDAVYALETAKKRRRSAQRIKDKKLQQLKEKLAEWETDPLPGFLPDRSVEA